MSTDGLQLDVPAEHDVTLLTVRAELSAMDIGVTI
jgi:hypothetical protein